MPRKSKTDQELAYLRAAWEEIEDIRLEYQFDVTVLFIPQVSRGVWNIRVLAESNERHPDGTPLRAEGINIRFPNGRDTSLAGELWNVLHSLARQAAEGRDLIARSQAKG